MCFEVCNLLWPPRNNTRARALHSRKYSAKEIPESCRLRKAGW